MAAVVPGARSWSLNRTEEGYREYTLKSIVRVEPGEGPFAALNASGLFQPGSVWNLGGTEVDPWSWCRPGAKVTIHEEKEGERATYYAVEQVFSNRPPARGNRSPETPVENPLNEPYKISGGNTKFTEEGMYDSAGKRIMNGAFEQIRGPQNEWDAGRPTVRIQQNVANLQLDLLAQMVETLNSIAMWGLPPRAIKLSNYSWEKIYYKDFLVYYQRTLEFEVMYRRLQGVGSTEVPAEDPENPSTWTPVLAGRTQMWDREVLDEATKCLRGKWDKDPSSPTYKKYIPDVNADRSNPRDYIRFKDFNNQPIRGLLDGMGEPFDPTAAATKTADWWQQGGSIPNGAAIINATYATASNTATLNGALLYGPFRETPDQEAGYPLDENPFLKPGRVLINKYGQSDFRVLGVPVSLT